MAINKKPAYVAFTAEFSGRARQLISKCHISLAFGPGSPPPGNPMREYAALWDTGAMGTVISQKVINELGLQPVGFTKMNHAGGSADTEIYLINIRLPNNVSIRSVKAIRGNLKGADVLIGMDIITMGDFAITNFQGKTTFTFRVPSLEQISFAGRNPNQKPSSKTHYNGMKVGRNEKCPCGSGKKFKQCHGE